MPSLKTCLRDAADFKDLKSLAHPRTRQGCGKPNVFEGGVRTYTKVMPGGGLHMLLGEFECGVSVEDFKGALGFQERILWDDLFTGGRDLEAFRIPGHPTLDVFHRHMSFRSPAPMLISPRDFEVLISERFEPDGSFICKAVSVDPPRTQPLSGVIRGEILTTGFIVTKNGDSACKVIYVAQIHPKGWIPVKVVNLIMAKQAKSVINLKKHIQKKIDAKRRKGMSKL